MPVTAAPQMRRWIGTLVPFLVFVWGVVLIAGLAGAFQGARLPLLNVMVALIQGCAFVLAAFFSIQLHRTDDTVALDRIWSKALVYGIAGTILLIAGAYSLYAM